MDVWKRKMPKNVAVVVGVVLCLAVIATVWGGYTLKVHSVVLDLEMHPPARPSVVSSAP